MRISRQATLSGSALASAQYQSAAASLSFIPIPAWSLSLQTTMAQEQYTHHAGSKESLSLRYQLNPSASIQAAWTTTSAGFRELSDAVNHTTSTANSYYNVGGNWAHEHLGLFSLSYSTSSARDHAATPMPHGQKTGAGLDMVRLTFRPHGNVFLAPGRVRNVTMMSFISDLGCLWDTIA